MLDYETRQNDLFGKTTSQSKTSVQPLWMLNVSLMLDSALKDCVYECFSEFHFKDHSAPFARWDDFKQEDRPQWLSW